MNYELSVAKKNLVSKKNCGRIRHDVGSLCCFETKQKTEEKKILCARDIGRESRDMFGIDHLVQKMQLTNREAYFSGVTFLIIIYSR